MCPAGAFREDEKMVVIDPDLCIMCGVCIPDCQQGAITTDKDAEEKWIKYNSQIAPILPPCEI